eukprot:gene4116-8182_t
MKLQFGYEKPPPISKNKSAQSLITRKIKSQYALCQPMRPRGCEPLLTNSFQVNLTTLPCVTSGSCPYIRFRCTKGHEWKASPGTPVCFHCPICKQPRKVYGTKEIRIKSAHDLVMSIESHCKERGGDSNTSSIQRISSTSTFTCDKGHSWKSTVNNIINRNSWCPICNKISKRLNLQDLHDTAKYFQGEYIGIVSDTTKLQNQNLFESNVSVSITQLLHKWRCQYGHEFIQRPNNIRRNMYSKRKCSWCPSCRKNGLKFNWDASAASLFNMLS